MSKVIAIEDYKNICFKCLQEKPTTKYSLYRMNYGSSFDNNYTYLQICKDCEPQDIDKWFNEEPEVGEWGETYEYEKNIIDFVNTFPIEGQELFWARCSYGADSEDISGQDWIDMKLGILPDERYEELGYYSPRQERAYQEKFPICEHVKIVKYEDDSQGSKCPFGAFGNEDGSAEEHQIQDECYECRVFIPRETEEIEVMSKEEVEIYELQNQLALKMLLKKLKDENKL